MTVLLGVMFMVDLLALWGSGNLKHYAYNQVYDCPCFLSYGTSPTVILVDSLLARVFVFSWFAYSTVCRALCPLLEFQALLCDFLMAAALSCSAGIKVKLFG